MSSITSAITDADLIRWKKYDYDDGDIDLIIERLISEVEKQRKEIVEDDEIIDDLRCAGAKRQAEIERMWAQFGRIKDILALADELTKEKLKASPIYVKAAMEIAAKEYLAYPKSTSGGVALTDEVIENLAAKAEAGYDPAKLKKRDE